LEQFTTFYFKQYHKDGQSLGPTRSSLLADDIGRRQQQHPPAKSRRRSGPRERVCQMPWGTSFSRIMACITFSLPHYLCAWEPVVANNISVKDKANHAVVLDKATSDKLNKDVQSYRLITVAVLVDRLKINGSLARQALNDLEDRGVIKKVVGHSRGSIYTRAAAGGD
jgi:small subunit ribosomal protein S25e